MPGQDPELARQAKAALTQDPRVAPAQSEIDVEAEDGVVTLRGTVERLPVRGAAEAVVRGLPSVKDVKNLLLVGPRHRADEEVQKAVFDALTQDPYIDERCVQVSVDRGVVTLEGVVESLTHKRLAEGITWWIRGVRGVVNRLRTRQVTTPELESNDELIAEAIEVLMDKDPLVDDTQVDVLCRGGVVTLSGAVRSEVERDAAETDAWATLGVRDVRNELQAVPGPLPGT